MSVFYSVNNSFIFSVSALTVFLSLFLNDGNLIFFWDIIFFIISIFIFSCWNNPFSVWFGFVMIPLSFFCSLFGLNRCWFSSIWCVDYSFRVLLIKLFVYLFVYFWFSRPENQPFFIISLACSASTCLVLNLAHSHQISIILSLLLLWVELHLKKSSASLLFSLVNFLCWCLWFVWQLLSSFVYLRKEQPTFAGYHSFPRLAIREAVAVSPTVC